MDKAIDIKTKLEELEDKRTVMTAYLLTKFNDSNWRAVQAAASDLQCIESEMNIWKEVKSSQNMVTSIKEAFKINTHDTKPDWYPEPYEM